jgi:hypothetical protein
MRGINLLLMLALRAADPRELLAERIFRGGYDRPAQRLKSLALPNLA